MYLVMVTVVVIGQVFKEWENRKEKMNVERKPIYCVMEGKKRAGRDVGLRG